MTRAWTGSEKQIAWAKDIVSNKTEFIVSLVERYKAAAEAEDKRELEKVNALMETFFCNLIGASTYRAAEMDMYEKAFEASAAAKAAAFERGLEKSEAIAEAKSARAIVKADFINGMIEKSFYILETECSASFWIDRR